jgi:hypothetical protein
MIPDYESRLVRVKELHAQHPDWGERTLSLAAGLSRRQVRAALDRAA